MPEVRAAAGAVHLRADHVQASVGLRLDRVLGEGSRVARPAASTVVLGGGIEERGAAADAVVRAGVVVIPVTAAERSLGSFLARNAVLLRRKLRAPLGLRLPDLLQHGDLQ